MWRDWSFERAAAVSGIVMQQVQNYRLNNDLDAHSARSQRRGGFLLYMFDDHQCFRYGQWFDSAIATTTRQCIEVWLHGHHQLAAGHDRYVEHVALYEKADKHGLAISIRSRKTDQRFIHGQYVGDVSPWFGSVIHIHSQSLHDFTYEGAVDTQSKSWSWPTRQSVFLLSCSPFACWHLIETGRKTMADANAMANLFRLEWDKSRETRRQLHIHP